MFTENYRFSFSKLGKLVLQPIAWVAVYSTTLFVLSERLSSWALDIPFAVSSLLGLTISLILGFKTNSAYERWWEARKLWGAIVNDSRNLTRQVLSFTKGDQNLAGQLVRHQIAWCHALRISLRRQENWGEVEEYLGTDSFSSVSKDLNVPNAISLTMSKLIKEMKENRSIDEFQFLALEGTLARLMDHMGGCERIKNTVFPMQYIMLSRWSIIIFMIMLPYGMLDDIGIFVIPVSIIVVLFFSLIESIAISLKDPFSDRPTDIPIYSICRTIEINLLQMLEAEEVPAPLAADPNGVLM